MALVWASDLFVGFDSSVAHVACAFTIPSVVLWDPFRKLEIEERCNTYFAPAAMSRWGYPQNRNFMLLGIGRTKIVGRIADWVREFARSMNIGLGRPHEIESRVAGERTVLRPHGDQTLSGHNFIVCDKTSRTAPLTTGSKACRFRST